MAMTNAERQRRFRERQKARQLDLVDAARIAALEEENAALKAAGPPADPGASDDERKAMVAAVAGIILDPWPGKQALHELPGFLGLSPMGWWAVGTTAYGKDLARHLGLSRMVAQIERGFKAYIERQRAETALVWQLQRETDLLGEKATAADRAALRKRMESRVGRKR